MGKALDLPASMPGNSYFKDIPGILDLVYSGKLDLSSVVKGLDSVVPQGKRLETLWQLQINLSFIFSVFQVTCRLRQPSPHWFVLGSCFESFSGSGFFKVTRHCNTIFQ